MKKAILINEYNGLKEHNPDSIIPCHAHAIDGKYCLILWSSTAGMALKWFKNNFCENYEDFNELTALAEKIEPGANGLTMLPHLCGSTMPKYNPDAKVTTPSILKITTTVIMQNVFIKLLILFFSYILSFF